MKAREENYAIIISMHPRGRRQISLTICIYLPYLIEVLVAEPLDVKVAELHLGIVDGVGYIQRRDTQCPSGMVHKVLELLRGGHGMDTEGGSKLIRKCYKGQP